MAFGSLLKVEETADFGPAVVWGSPLNGRSPELLISWVHYGDLYVQRISAAEVYSKYSKVKPDSSLYCIDAPAMAFLDGYYYLAVLSTESDDEDEDWQAAPNLMRSTDGVLWGPADFDWPHYGYFPATDPHHGVALAAVQNRLYISWCMADGVIWVQDTSDARDFGVKLKERSPSAPALASNGEELLLAWRGADNRLNVIRRNGAEFVAGRVILGDTTDARPALISCGGEMILAWQGVNNHRLNTLVSRDGGVIWRGKFTSEQQTSVGGPAFAANGPSNDVAWLAWTGTGSKHYLNLADVTG